MPKVICPVDLESQVVVSVDHLVSHGVLQMALIFHLIGAKKNSILRVEPTSLSTRATTTVDVMAVEIASKLADVIAEVTDDGACTNKDSVSRFQPYTTRILHSLY